MDPHIPQVDNPTSIKRRWPRLKLDVPVRVVIHETQKTVIRDGRGRELSEGGMCFSAGVELKVGDQVEVEFTPAYSGHPIRVRAIARNRNGYSYGVEFVASSDQERNEIVCLRDNLLTMSYS
jgi:hypothetical protein